MIQQNFCGTNVDWNHVFYFSEVAAAGSIKEAAEKLDLSPSTLSGHIAQLEKNLKVQLFHRGHRRITLTEQGSKLFQYAKQMFETGRRLIDVVSPISVGYYPISIGLVPGPSMPFAYKLVGQYVATYENVNIRVSQARHEDLERGLTEARFDFGFSCKAPERKDVVGQLLSDSPLRFFVAEHLRKTNFSDLAQKLPMVICGAESRGLDIIDALLEDTEVTPRSIITTDYPSLALELCRKGGAIGVFTEETMRKTGAESLETVAAPLNAPSIADKLYVLWSKDADHSKAVKHLKTFFSEIDLKKQPPRPQVSKKVKEITL